MTDVNNIPEEELNATGNESQVESTTPTTDTAPAPEAPKALSLDDAVAAAFSKHSDPAAQPAPATPQRAPTAAPAPVAEAVDPITGEKLLPINVPGSAPPGIRARWANIDRETQKYIVDRDRHISTELTKTADERKLAAEFKGLVAPYETTLSVMGVTAPQVTKQLFGYWNTLATGSSNAKAQVIDSLIRQFGSSDPQMLQALGQLATGNPLPAAPAPALDAQALKAELKKELAEENDQRQAMSEIEKFSRDPKNAYFNDVREMMGRAIDGGWVTGETVPEMFKNAYDWACQQHPEIRALLAQQSATQPAMPAQAPVAPKPVGQIKPSLSGGKQSAAPVKAMSLDEAIKAAAAKHGM